MSFFQNTIANSNKKYYNKNVNNKNKYKGNDGGKLMKNIKENSGVTLVALIVTIVVLLILAGVSIASFVGDKGLLNETKDMKNNIEDIQNQTIDNLHSIANELSTSAGDALNP